MVQQDVHVGYKGASIGISVTTKMIHIDSTKLHQKAFEGKPWKATITFETLTEACETGLHPRMATLPFLPRQRPIVVSPCFLQPMPPQKSYTPPHKNLIFLISFPCWATVCNSSTKALVSFFGLNTEETTESPVLFGLRPSHSDILYCCTSKQPLIIIEKVKNHALATPGN